MSQISQKAMMPAAKPALAEATESRALVRPWIACMRPYQWVKNLFVLAPLLFGQKLGELWAVGQAALAFGCFCLLSSALYVFNDIVDARADRLHPEKRYRPIACGAVPMGAALFCCAVLLLAAFWMASAAGMPFLALVLTYFGCMVGYCLGLKRVVILDCMLIAAGFVLRVVGGAVVVQVQPTHWLIVCAFLLALYLAFAKRRQELLLLSGSAVHHRPVLGRYSVAYLDQVNNILVGAAIVCYALYTVAPDTVARFGSEALIYGTAFVIYGLLRYMAIIQNPANGGNPSKLLISDKPLLAAVIGWAMYNALVIYRAPLMAFWD